MRIETQVCSLEQSKRLKELGVEQKSVFYFHPAFDKPVFGEVVTTVTGKQYKKTQVCNDKGGANAAFTVAELGVMLPDDVRTNGQGILFVFNPLGNKLDKLALEGLPFDFKVYPTQAQASAAMLIHLLENNIITVQEVNKRLAE